MVFPSLSKVGPSTLASNTNRASMPRTSIVEQDSSGRKSVLAWTPTITPTVAATATTTTTTATSPNPSRRSSGITKETTTTMTSIAASSCDGGTFDGTSSATLQDEFPWHEVRTNDHAHQRIPSVIFPALLHTSGDSNHPSLSPLRQLSLSSLLAADVLGEDGESGGDESVNTSQYSITEKGKWKVMTDDEDNVRRSRSPSPQFSLPSIDTSVEDWAAHNRPILREYAERQTSLPLGRRLEVSIDEPSDFVLGSLQLLVNRDRKDSVDRSRQLGPQLIENFINIDRWAKEYFRSRHGVTNICNDVSTLLTIVMNGFYEGLVQLIDRLVEFALEQMRFCGRTSLVVEDFSFGYDFRMSQDLPFYVETSSRIREPLPVRTEKVQLDTEPVTTHSGRHVRPTKRAQEACGQAATGERRNKGKGKGPSQVVKGKRVPKGAIAPPRQRKNSAQPRSNDSETDLPTSETSLATPTSMLPPPPQKAMPSHTKHPSRPSSLGLLPPISPALLSSEIPSESYASASTSVSASGNVRNISRCTGSDTTTGRPPPCRLKIVIPWRAASKRLPSATANSCRSTTAVTTTNEANTKSMAQKSASETANKVVVYRSKKTSDTNAGSTTLQTGNSPENDLGTANEGEEHVHGCLFGSVNSVVGGSGIEVWPRCPSGPSAGDNSGGDGGRASGGGDDDTGCLCANGSIELTLNAGGSTSASIHNELTRAMRAGAKGEDESENNSDVVAGLPMELTTLTGAQIKSTGDAPSSCSNGLDVINGAVDDTREDDHAASGNVDTREKESLLFVPPSDPEPGRGSGSGRLRGRKRKLDECEI